MQQPVTIFFGLMVLALCGCSSLPSTRDDAAQLKLLPPLEGAGITLLKQRVAMESHDFNQQFITVLRLRDGLLKLAALLPTGQQLFLLEYDGHTLTQKNISTIDIPGRDILAVIQFSLWPPESIRQHYGAEDGWTVKISAQQRTLSVGTRVLLKVKYQAESVIIDNQQHNYRLKVQPL